MINFCLFIVVPLIFGLMIALIRELQGRVDILEKRMDCYLDTNKELLKMIKELEERKK